MSTLFDTVIASAEEVHRELGGAGLVESIYESALCYELSARHLSFQRQLPVPVLYKKTSIRPPLYLDILVENELVIEVKALANDNPYYLAQLCTHMRLLHLHKGLLLNFGKERLLDGILRVEI